MDLELDHTYDLGGPESPQLIDLADAPPQTQQGIQEQVQEDPVQEEIKKRTVKPLFDTKRLLSDAGLPKLRKTLLKTSFKHRDAPRKDLQKLVSIYELWGHRLFPRSNLEDISSLLLKSGENAEVKIYRRGLVDQDKYGSLEAEQGSAEDPVDNSITDPAADPADVPAEDSIGGLEPVGVDQTHTPAQPKPKPQPKPKTSAAPSSQRTTTIDDSDSESDLELPAPPAEPSDIPNEDDLAEIQQQDEWAIYRELGF